MAKPESFYEILEDVANVQDAEEKVARLRSYIAQDPFFRNFLLMTQDPKWEWSVTPSLRWRPSSRPDIKQALRSEVRRLYIFTKTGHPGLSQKRRDELAIQFLEGIDAKDAGLMATLFRTGKISFRAVSDQVIKAALGVKNEQGLPPSS